MSTPEGDAERAVEVTVTGTVQGVGFRPFVARTAATHDLAGSVRNTDDGVVVRFEGAGSAVEAAVERLRTDPPPLARVDTVRVAEDTPEGDSEFDILASTARGDRTTLVPPDTGLCEACRADLRDPMSRYYGYWATTCVDCGPRFSITGGLPYDRERTALTAFEPCQECQAAYERPTDRRFHAQTVACRRCGPTPTLYDADGDAVTTGRDALARLASRLRAGDVVGIKGAGGTHLACRARDTAVVTRLRSATGRPRKPYALMVPDLDTSRRFAHVSPREQTALTDQRRPIVVLDRRPRPWLEAVAPGLHTVGVMLPYSGLHHLLFEELDEPLVMTSANRPGEPMATTREELCATAPDAVLAHDRDVVARCDDSVVRVVDGRRQFLRRSRGWVPERLPLPDPPERPVVALGGRSDVTVAVADDQGVVLSQHVGSVTDPATEQFHRDATAHLTDLLGVAPDTAAHDCHPDFRTTTMADEYSQQEPIQHHHAHAAGLLAEHGCNRAVVVAADGTGYGPDGIVRGGEILESQLTHSNRVGGLSEFCLPGGEAAVRRPARTLASLLADDDRVADLLSERGVGGSRAVEAVLQQAEWGTNAPPTTSAGRFLDAAAALVDVCTERRYRGEPAMQLAATASRGTPVELDPPVDRTGGMVRFRADRAMARLADLAERHSRPDVAATAQAVLADGLGTCAVAAAERAGVDTVGFTGGVAYNPAIAARLRKRVTATGLDFIRHDAVPPGDAGLAYGQAVTACARWSAD